MYAIMFLLILYTNIFVHILIVFQNLITSEEQEAMISMTNKVKQIENTVKDAQNIVNSLAIHYIY